MNKHLKTTNPILLISLAMLSLSACYSTPTTSDLMRDHVKDLQDQVGESKRLADDWDRGQDLLEAGMKNVDEGERLVRESEANLQKGRDLIARGNGEIDEGRKLQRDSELRFRAAFPGIDFTPRK